MKFGFREISGASFQMMQEAPGANGKTSAIAEAPKTLRSRGAKRILLVTTVFNLAYRVAQCAHAAGTEVYVLGNPGASAFRSSRCCRAFHRCFVVINGERDRNLALEINGLARKFGIDMVAPGCAYATRALIAARDLIEPPCFPLPSLDAFDLLNNKWSFAQLCDELCIQHPATRLFPNAESLADTIARGAMQPPLIAKPLDWSGGSLGAAGIVKIDRPDEDLAPISYEPVLVQEFIKGTEIGASIYALGGRVLAFIAHRYSGRVYSTFHDEGILAATKKIAARLNLDGVYNFDMIRTADNVVHFLECNPRFFFKISLSLAAGINFFAEGLNQDRSDEIRTVPEGTTVRQPEALIASLFRHGVTQGDLALARQHFSDPGPYLLEGLNLTI